MDAFVSSISPSLDYSCNCKINLIFFDTIPDVCRRFLIEKKNGSICIMSLNLSAAVSTLLHLRKRTYDRNF